MTEFNLSDHIYVDGAGNHKLFPVDVREAVRLLKEELNDFKNSMWIYATASVDRDNINLLFSRIDKIFGDKLI